MCALYVLLVYFLKIFFISVNNLLKYSLLCVYEQEQEVAQTEEEVKIIHVEPTPIEWVQQNMVNNIK